MTTYVIDYSDPLRNEFNIVAGGFNGPGGSSVSSTLRLYGRGALEWGESVDEDLLRLAENFSGSTAPLSPISGQLWLSTKFYWHNTTAPAVGLFVQPFVGWWFFDPNANTWAMLNGNGSVAGPIAPASPNIGDYYFDGITLFRWDSLYKQVDPMWVVRTFTMSTTNPLNSPLTDPEQALYVWDGYKGVWTSPSIVYFNDVAPPTQKGGLWYAPTAGNLSMWDGAAWQSLVITGHPLTGDIDMGTHRIINMSDPTTPQGAATRAWAVAKSGGLVDGQMTGLLYLSGDPVVALGAATKQYVDNTASSATSGTVLPGSGKAGDIFIKTDDVPRSAWVFDGVVWNQFYPATYA